MSNNKWENTIQAGCKAKTWRFSGYLILFFKVKMKHHLFFLIDQTTKVTILFIRVLCSHKKLVNKHFT